MSNRAARRWGLIRLSYLMPAISGVLLLIWGLIPHLYFYHDGAAYETMSSLSLVTNTFSTCREVLNGSTEGSELAILFSNTMRFFCVLFWLGVLSYTLAAVTSAICSCYAFSKDPTSRDANRAKRWMRFFCPGRVGFVLMQAVALLSAAFPHILTYFYRMHMGYRDMSVHFFGPSDLVLCAILLLCNIALFLATLRAQAEEHMDMYRLYKAKQD